MRVIVTIACVLQAVSGPALAACDMPRVATHVDPDKTAILSWRGYFAAEDGGGQAVHANRTAIGPWETHFLDRNPDGTVSFRALGGHYFVAEMGGGPGSVCNWNRTAIGPWEKFWMEHQGDGTFALRTFEKGTYVSVQ